MTTLPSPTSDRESYAIALAHTTAKLWFGRGDLVDDDDLLGAALLGAAQALARYDERQGVAFRSYAIRRIRGEIQEELRRWDHLDRDTRAALREIEGNLPDWLQSPMSLDMPVAFSADWETAVTVGEQIVDKQIDVEAEALEACEPEAALESAVSRALAALDAEEREVVEWIFWRDGSLIDLARAWGCDWKLIRRRRDRALSRLKRRLAR